MKEREFSDLKGSTMRTVEKGSNGDGNDALVFTTDTDRRFILSHYQNCCERVHLEDVCGDLADLVGYPLLEASETSNQEETGDGSQTWTFYRLSTVKGTVTLRWLGESNGYYSESVDLVEVEA